MKKNARRFRTKERRLLQLYSQWQETRRYDLQERWMGLLGEMLAVRPGFSLRKEFQRAF